LATIVVIVKRYWFVAKYAEEWKRYTNLLIAINVRLKEKEDQLIWSLNQTGANVPRLGYKALAKEGREAKQIWWWKMKWKLKWPTKINIFMQPGLYDKATTWDVLQKKNFIGPEWHCQCHQVEESIVHLMLE
jgi:hypothetical protein